MMQIRIGRVTYKVVRESPDGGSAGESDPENATIRIQPEAEGEVFQSYLEHEVAHSAAEESGAREIIRRFTRNEKAADDLEELLVCVWFPVYAEALKK